MNNLQIYNLFRKKKSVKDGLLFTYEGIDGSGKNTQVNNTADYLQDLGYKVKTFKFPQYENIIGKVISEYLRGEYGDINGVPYKLICIAYAADRVEASREIKSLLNTGYIILSDRYTYSNIFTAAKMEESKWIPFIKWIEDLEFNQLGVIKPNYNIYLHVDPKISIQRINERGKRDYQNGKDDIHESNSNLLINTSKAYLELANRNSNWYIIDQMKNGKQISKEDTFEKLKLVMNSLLK